MAAMGWGEGLVAGWPFSRGWRAGRAGLGFLLFTAQHHPGALVKSSSMFNIGMQLPKHGSSSPRQPVLVFEFFCTIDDIGL